MRNEEFTACTVAGVVATMYNAIIHDCGDVIGSLRLSTLPSLSCAVAKEKTRQEGTVQARRALYITSVPQALTSGSALTQKGNPSQRA